MISAVLCFLLTSGLAYYTINRLKKRYTYLEDQFLKRLYFYHLALTLVYYLYALFNASDSRYYYKKVVTDFRGPEWFDFYGTSTTFIEFLAYPFIRYLGFSYDAMMILYSFIGYLGLVFFYIFFRENIKFRHRLFGFDLLFIFFLLPNLHFWSASLGKGPIILLGIGLFFYGLSKLGTRYIALLLGALIVYHVRPHIMLVILVSSILGFVFSAKGLNVSLRVIFLIGAIASFFYIYSDVLTMVGVEGDELLTEGLDLSRRARELSSATSGIDISNYSLPLQLFTFVYRPLFFDAPGVLGLIVSVENVFYLLISLRLFTPSGLRFLFSSSALVKSAFFSFLTASLALAQISGNLGIAIRQKSQVMLLFLFVILLYMDNVKIADYQKLVVSKLKRKKAEPPHSLSGVNA